MTRRRCVNCGARCDVSLLCFDCWRMGLITAFTTAVITRLVERFL